MLPPSPSAISLDITINRADQALYVGKLQGRNRVVPAS